MERRLWLVANHGRFTDSVDRRMVENMRLFELVKEEDDGAA